MDWSKARRITVLVLIALNIVLLVLNNSQKSQYTISKEEVDVIIKVLSDNSIELDTDILTSYEPMVSLGVRAENYDIEDVKDRFFGVDSDVKNTIEFNKTILFNDKNTLTIENNHLLYEIKEGTGYIEDFNEQTAQTAAEAYVKSVDKGFSNFELEYISFRDGNYIFLYNQKFKKSKIFSSFKEITVSSLGVIRLEQSNYEPESYTGEKREIYSADEAMLTLMQEISSLNFPSLVRVVKIDLGYDFKDMTDVSDGRQLNLIPYYRIYIDNYEEPFLINAYTNEIKK